MVYTDKPRPGARSSMECAWLLAATAVVFQVYGLNRRVADGWPELELEVPQVVLVTIVSVTGQGEGAVVGTGRVESPAIVVPPPASLIGCTVP